MADEQAEIITRPPSHPVATTLLFASIVGTILSISFVWMELYGEYQPAPPGSPGAPPALKDPLTGQPVMANHDPVGEATAAETVHDHYAEDFGTGPVLQSVEEELGVHDEVGNPSPVEGR